MARKKLAVVLGCAIGLAHGAYDADDTLKLNAEVGYGYDDNVFRLSEQGSNSITRKHGQQGDSKLDVALGGRIDVPVSRQNFSASARVNRQQYMDFSELNYTGWQADLGWAWQAGSLLSGQLNAGTSRSMSSFEDTRDGRIDMVRQSNVQWQGAYLILSNWALVADVGYSKQTHDVRTLEDAKNLTYGLGMRYRTEYGSSLTVRQQWQDYDYLRNLAFIPADRRGYEERLTQLVLQWPYSEKLNISASGGVSSWKSKLTGERSSSTPQGNLDLTWQATGKTKLRAGYGQNFDQFTSGAGRDLQRVTYLGAAWAMSEKWLWDLELRHWQKQTEMQAGQRLRDEQYESAKLSVVFKPARAWSIRSYLRWEQREDQMGSADYDLFAGGITGRYDF
ncbi:hypothetical protein [Chitinibacter sp. ZOR0017]|uniref:hypothetical protein n=1 Tax=Chitinibacter sp. ZOR0017 TaxID=1339254 RepID=UPI000648F957|nr:hypothetical protein [Chitinibacter sp. ZOR0017]